MYGDGKHIAVGVDQNTSLLGTLPRSGQRGGIAIHSGQLADGAGEQVVSNYLAATVELPDLRYRTSPVVRFGGDGNAADFERVVRAVQLINTALPEGYKMRVASDGATTDTGTGIYFNFMDDFGGDYWGITYNSNSGVGNQITHSQININTDYRSNGDRQATILLAHELLHALGFFGGQGQGHVPTSIDSILEAGSGVYHTRQRNAQPLSLLFPADREALRALYAFGRGASVNAFGPWSSTGHHLMGHGQSVLFGSVWRNGYAEPWAYGIKPNEPLAQNTALTGSATWTGLLLGWSRGNAVSGDAEIGVNLGTMHGNADFTELTRMDTNTQWLDGDLAYTISVDGNTFRETGGDAGRLTGVFVGLDHEGAAGTLERSDLTAAFGATR